MAFTLTIENSGSDVQLATIAVKNGIDLRIFPPLPANTSKTERILVLGLFYIFVGVPGAKGGPTLAVQVTPKSDSPTAGKVTFACKRKTDGNLDPDFVIVAFSANMTVKILDDPRSFFNLAPRG